MILVFGGTTEGRMAAKELEEAGSVFYYSTKGGEQQLTLLHGQLISGAMDREEITEFCNSNNIRLIIDAAHPFASELHCNIAEASKILNIPVIRFERIYPPRDSRIVWCKDFSDAVSIISNEFKRHSVEPKRHLEKCGHLVSECRDSAAKQRNNIAAQRRDNTGRKSWRLLSTAGVQSIPKLRPLEEAGIEVFHRILDRPSSRELAYRYGVALEHLCFYRRDEDENVEIDRVGPDAILLKESGLTGGYIQKTEAALNKGIMVFAIERPLMPESFVTVNGPYGMRRMVEKLLPEFFPLHSGLTTGSCATAAAVAAAKCLMEGICPESVDILLPDEENISVDTCCAVSLETERCNTVSSQTESETQNALPTEPETNSSVSPEAERCSTLFSASELHDTISSEPESQLDRLKGIKAEAFVIKDSGDDPDVTDKMEIHAKVFLLDSADILIEGGAGVGRITLQGFDYPPGEAAINKGPRKMIADNLKRLYPNNGFKVIISVPGGEDVARRTFNPRLGIEGGISIIGVSGIIKPFSEEGFINSIRKCMDVAKASGCSRVVINSGAKSENFLKDYYKELPPQCFVQYGNKIGDTISIAYELGFRQITLGVMLGKAVKLAAGNLDTHSSAVTMDRDFIATILKSAGCEKELVEKAQSITLARELWDILPDNLLQSFVNEIKMRCKKVCLPLCPEADLIIFLIDDSGKIY